jgi:hypothetical protein
MTTSVTGDDSPTIPPPVGGRDRIRRRHGLPRRREWAEDGRHP